MSARPTRPPESLRGTVLFVHGLWMTGAESLLLRYQLRRRGWALRIFPYSSLAESMDEVAKRCARDALALARRTLLPVHLLGHSLGGFVIYRMFETGLLAPDRFSSDFCRVVFLGTPSRGSQAARALVQLRAGRRMLGVGGGELLREELPDRWPFAPQLGIIAGNSPRGLGRLLTHIDGPNDGTVAVTETQMDGATDRCVLPVSHSGLWLSTAVAEQVAAFLDHGRFDADQVAGAGSERSR